MFKIEIDLSNAAFHPDPRHEIARILSNYAGAVINQDVPADSIEAKVRDINGNTVGLMSYSFESEVE